MPDDRFDRDLAQRLRAYESRMPDAEAPSPVDAGKRSPWAWLMGVGALGIVAAGMLALVLTNTPRTPVGESSPSPLATSSPAASASVDPSPSSAPERESPTASVPPESSAPPAELSWSKAGTFGSDGGSTMVNDVVVHGGGLIAVGTEYGHPLPILGPSPPRDGRMWASVDGRSWADQTPDGTFDDAELRLAYAGADGALIAVGTRRVAEADGQETFSNLAWESTDGVRWAETAIGLPEESLVHAIEHGSRGYLARVTPAGATHGSEIWFSTDGRDWERVRTLLDGVVVIGAGDEGFVVAGTQGPASETGEPFAIASSDGREWFEASDPPPAATGVLPRGGDWIIVSHETGDGSLPDHASTWHSANGLDWSPLGDLPLDGVDVGGGRCAEIPVGPTVAGPWIVAPTTLSYPCGEGGFQVFGTQRISLDGSAWRALPLEAATPGEQGSGSLVHAATTYDGRIVLVGEANLKAAFWIGEAP